MIETFIKPNCREILQTKGWCNIMRMMKVFYIEEITDKDVRDVLTEYIGSNDSYISWHVKERKYYDEYAKPELIAINNGLITLDCDPGEEVLIAI